MNLYQTIETFQKMFPGKTITTSFDEKTIRQKEIIMTDGMPNPVHHVEHQHVKVTVEGMDPVYVPINPHRECWTWDYMQSKVAALPKETWKPNAEISE